MTTMDENAKSAGEFKDNLNEAANTQQKIKENLNEILFEQRNLADEARGFAKAVFDSSTQATSTAAAFRGIASISSTINSKIEDIVTGEKTLNDLQKDRNKLREKENSLGVELNQAVGEFGATNVNIQEILKNNISLYDALGDSVENLDEDQLALLGLYESQLNILRDQKAEYDEIEDFAKQIDNNMGVAGKATEGLSGVLGKIGAGDIGKKLGLDDAIKVGRKEAAKLAGTAGDGMTPMGKQLKVAGKMIGTIGKSLAKALGPVTIIAELVKGLMVADKQTNELGRSMMMTQRESMQFSRNIQTATTNNYQFGITATKVLGNIIELNKQFGFITEFSGETLVSMTKLTHTLKIGAEEAGNLAAAAEATGVNFEDNYKNILAASYELQQQAGTQVDLRQVLTETGKVTGQIRANFSGNTVEIAKAVTNARLLGTEMGAIAAAGKQLLDFESSINAEMEAELLTGRNLNLERARAAALTGDQVTLQNELAREMGSFSDFSKLNVIQQEALAGAMGMSVDSMSDMLFNQETMNKSAKELRALGKDELANRLEQKTAQDKMNASMDQLKQVFVDLGTALLPIVNIVGIVAGLISAIVGFVQDLIGGIGALFGMNDDFEFGKSAGFEGLKQTVKSGKQLFVGDAVIGPSGDIITTSPEDFLIATKDPGEMLDNVSISSKNIEDTPTNSSLSPPQTIIQQDNSESKKTNALLEALINKPAPKVQMDSIEVGTVAGMSAFSIQ